MWNERGNDIRRLLDLFHPYDLNDYTRDCEVPGVRFLSDLPACKATTLPPDVPGELGLQPHMVKNTSLNLLPPIQ